MEEKSVQELVRATHYPRLMGATALGMLALFLLVGTISELKSYHFIGSGVAATNTISVTGEGDVYAIPDTATFTVTVLETASDVKTAQDTATKKINDIKQYLTGQGVDEKDIQTTDYSVSPQYQWSAQVCSTTSYCPPGKQTLSGYQVSETYSVKVRDTTKAGALLAGVGTRGASQVSDLSFTVDNQDALNDQARDKAIAVAKIKADALAKSLGVSLVRVVGFSENGTQPIYYAKVAAPMAVDSTSGAAIPDVSAGQNKITSNVSITYEIQ